MKVAITRLLQEHSLFHPRPIQYRDVELRSDRLETSDEVQALETSAAHYNEAAIQICPRVTTIVQADAIDQCYRKAEINFEEVLDVLCSSVVMSRFTLRRTGFIRCLRTLSLTPLTSEHHPVEQKPTTTFVMQRYADLVPLTFEQRLLLVNATELIESYRRALHWRRRARWEADPQLSILFHWFSIEAATRQSADDDILPVIETAIGFPNATRMREINAQLLTDLNTIKNYRHWRQTTHADLEQMRSWRNDSVHSGFRRWDTDDASLRRYYQLSVFGCSRVLGLGLAALSAGLTTKRELREYMDLLVSERDGYLNDVRGTIIYLFEHPGKAHF